MSICTGNISHEHLSSSSLIVVRPTKLRSCAGSAGLLYWDLLTAVRCVRLCAAMWKKCFHVWYVGESGQEIMRGFILSQFLAHLNSEMANSCDSIPKPFTASDQ